MTICHVFAHTQIYTGIEVDYIEQTVGFWVDQKAQWNIENDQRIKQLLQKQGQ